MKPIPQEEMERVCQKLLEDMQRNVQDWLVANCDPERYSQQDVAAVAINASLAFAAVWSKASNSHPASLIKTALEQFAFAYGAKLHEASELPEATHTFMDKPIMGHA